MTERDASQLKKGERVMWDLNPADWGEVVGTDWSVVEISWERTGRGLHKMDEMNRVARVGD